MPDNIPLGTFSISLSVKDIAASRRFYEALGFEVHDGNQQEHWLIMKHGDAVVGLFQGMFEGNLLTFNPSDVRALQAQLQARDIGLIEEAKAGSGPTHISLQDPDGNVILCDQHAQDYTPNPQTID